MGFVDELYNPKNNQLKSTDPKVTSFLWMMKDTLEKEVHFAHQKGQRTLKGGFYHFFLDGDTVLLSKPDRKETVGAGFDEFPLEYMCRELKKQLKEMGFKDYKVYVGQLQFYEEKSGYFKNKLVKSHNSKTIYIDISW